MRVQHGAPLCALALLCLVSAGHEPIDVHPFPTCCFVKAPPDPTQPRSSNQFLEMNRSFELQYVMLVQKVIEDAPLAKRRWRVHTRGDVTVLRPIRGREPTRTLSSLIIVKQEDWTELTWIGQRFRWNAHTLETDTRLCGCDPTGEIFFERRGTGKMRCWNAEGKTVSCAGLAIPSRDRESALDALLRD